MTRTETTNHEKLRSLEWPCAQDDFLLGIVALDALDPLAFALEQRRDGVKIGSLQSFDTVCCDLLVFGAAGKDLGGEILESELESTGVGVMDVGELVTDGVPIGECE